MLAELEPPYILIKPAVSEENYYALGEDSPWELLDGRLVRSVVGDATIAGLEPPFMILKPADSEEDYYALGKDSDCEFLDGRLVLSSASNRHEDLSSFLNALVRIYVDERGGGQVRGSRYPMRLDERWSPEPDLLVVRPEHIDRMTAQRLEGPADWVIEIASEADPRFDRREKLPRYREAAIPEIWLIDPFAETIQVETLTDDGYRTAVHRDGRLAAAVVPGFWIDAGWLWRERLPSMMACLRELLG